MYCQYLISISKDEQLKLDKLSTSASPFSPIHPSGFVLLMAQGICLTYNRRNIQTTAGPTYLSKKHFYVETYQISSKKIKI